MTESTVNGSKLEARKVREQNLDGKVLVMFLSGLLIAQLALAALLKVSETKYQFSEPTASLLTCDFSSVNAIKIEEADLANDKKKSSITLKRDPNGWSLPDLHGFPASTGNVDQLINRLKGLKKGLPVLTSSGAVERFKVSPEKFERAISLYKGNEERVGTVYFGMSPNFRDVYARVSGDDNIYQVELPLLEITTRPENWLYKEFATYRSKDISGVDMGKFQVENTGGENWVLKSNGKEHRLSKFVALEFVNAVANLSIASVLGINALPEYQLENPILTFDIKLKTGKSIKYSFAKLKNGNYVLKMSNKDFFVEINQWLVRPILEDTEEAILKKEAASAAQAHGH
jgi:hypothetical protein